MWTTCSKWSSLFLLLWFSVSCQAQSISLQNDTIPGKDTIPAAVWVHFSVIPLDSAGALKAVPYRYETDTYIAIFSLEASFIDGRLKGKLRETRFTKQLPDLPVKEIKRNAFNISLNYKLCCSNHKPNHCVKNKSEASAYAGKYGCIGWRVIVI
jgi:hypothetical protein